MGDQEGEVDWSDEARSPKEHRADAVRKHGLTYKTKRGLEKVRPEVQIARDFAQLTLKLANDFGMTPASRVRLHVQPPDDDKPDPFAEFASRRRLN